MCIRDRRIITEAAKYGIGVKDIVVDPLALTVSSDKDSALVTLKAIEALHGMGIRTSLGVSNISFGLDVYKRQAFRLLKKYLFV